MATVNRQLKPARRPNGLVDDATIEHAEHEPPEPGDGQALAQVELLSIQSFLQADGGTRTPDPIITSDVLYQLSYVGEGSHRSDGLRLSDGGRSTSPRPAGSPPSGRCRVRGGP